MAATMQSTKAPVASSMATMRPRMARASAFRQMGTPSLKAETFGRTVAAKGLKASKITSRTVVLVRAADDKVVVIGLAADSGCGKSTFMR
jgi:hypothetical protein